MLVTLGGGGGGGGLKGFGTSITVCWIMYGYHKETLHVNH